MFICSIYFYIWNTRYASTLKLRESFVNVNEIGACRNNLCTQNSLSEYGSCYLLHEQPQWMCKVTSITSHAAANTSCHLLFYTFTKFTLNINKVYDPAAICVRSIKFETFLLESPRSELHTVSNISRHLLSRYFIPRDTRCKNYFLRQICLTFFS